MLLTNRMNNFLEIERNRVRAKVRDVFSHRIHFPFIICSLLDTYHTERRHSGINRFYALYRAIRWELTGKLYPS